MILKKVKEFKDGENFTDVGGYFPTKETLAFRALQQSATSIRRPTMPLP